MISVRCTSGRLSDPESRSQSSSQSSSSAIGIGKTQSLLKRRSQGGVGKGKNVLSGISFFH